MLLPPFLRYLPIPSMARVRRAGKQVDEIAYGIIRERQTSAKNNGDMLSLLMQARDEDGSGMSDKQLRDEAVTFLLAGHETTALSLSWAWYLLSSNPEVEQKLHAELHQVLAGRTPQTSDIPQLAYTEKVVKEAMRLYPPAWAVARTVNNECEVAGYRLPLGANVVVSPWVMHHDARFFTDPQEFNPDRWSTERTQTLPKYAYFPFGAGPRGCVGQSFAMMEATLLLATIAQRFRFAVVPDHPVVPMPSVTLRPKHGIRMVLHRR
jgi:cytochrome P450